MICVDKDDASRTVLVVSEKGFGKRTAVEEYRITNRGGKGVKTINVTEKTGQLVGILDVSQKEDLMIGGLSLGDDGGVLGHLARYLGDGHGGHSLPGEGRCPQKGPPTPFWPKKT